MEHHHRHRVWLATKSRRQSLLSTRQEDARRHGDMRRLASVCMCECIQMWGADGWKHEVGQIASQQPKKIDSIRWLFSVDNCYYKSVVVVVAFVFETRFTSRVNFLSHMFGFFPSQSRVAPPLMKGEAAAYGRNSFYCAKLYSQSAVVVFSNKLCESKKSSIYIYIYLVL